MERGFVFVVMIVMVIHLASAQDNLTRLGGFFLERFNIELHELTLGYLNDSLFFSYADSEDNSTPEFVKDLIEEHNDYTTTLAMEIAYEFSLILEDVEAQLVYEDLNYHCYGYLQTEIVDLRQELTETRCVAARLRVMTTWEMTRTIDQVLQQESRDCAQRWPNLCWEDKCTEVYDGRLRQLMRNYVQDVDALVSDVNDVLPSYADVLDRYAAHAKGVNGTTVLDVIALLAMDYAALLVDMFLPGEVLNWLVWDSFDDLPWDEPFGFFNRLQFWTNMAVKQESQVLEAKSVSRPDLTWGIIRSSTGSVDLPCSSYRHSGNSYTREFLRTCATLSGLQTSSELLFCAFSDLAASPLAWSTAASLYVHSPCLCVAANGTGCGVDSTSHCLAVLLRDFQRQVWFRPAVTYLDYAFQTRLPVCNFLNFLSAAFRDICDGTDKRVVTQLLLPSRCYFQNLVNKDLNCGETLMMDGLNVTELCAAKFFMEFVLCDDDGVQDLRVSYYGAGDSPWVLLLTFLDVVVRVLTAVTYLACPQLRNLPGKLLVAYLTTALLRLLVVLLEDLQWAVRLDVALDLASTLWLTAYLHFLTSSIKTLRLPDSLSLAEARQVLLRYSLLGWALPAALSATFFTLDEFLELRVKVGQLLFVLCNYAALCANLYMFYHNFSFYYDVRKCARELQRGITARKVFADLFNFALKTSLLSGAGITVRLVFTQVQGLEQLLGCYHALGTLQGLLVFLLYGCNHEARAFWVSVWRRLRPWPLPVTSLELVDLQNISSS